MSSPTPPSPASTKEVCAFESPFQIAEKQIADFQSFPTVEVKDAVAGTANVESGKAKGTAQEVAGEAKGKAAELKGQAKGKVEEIKGKM